MDARLQIARYRLERAFAAYAASGSPVSSLPPDALRLHRADDEPNCLDVRTVAPYVRLRQHEDVDLDVLYRELAGR